MRKELDMGLLFRGGADPEGEIEKGPVGSSDILQHRWGAQKKPPKRRKRLWWTSEGETANRLNPWGTHGKEKRGVGEKKSQERLPAPYERLVGGPACQV